MRTHCVYSAVLHNNNAVGILNRGNTLSYNNFGCIRYFRGKRVSYKRVGLIINCAGGVIKNNNFRLFKQCARNAEPLLLSS